MKKTHLRTKLIGIIAVSALLATACGADDTSPTESDEVEDTEIDPDTDAADDPEETEESPAEEREQITISIADINPSTHFVSENFVIAFNDYVEELSNGDIQVDYFPEGQLGSPADMVELLQSGVSDLSLVAPPYNSTEKPIGNAANLPRMTDSAEVLGRAYYNLIMREGTAMREVDFDRNNIVPLAAAALPLYQLVTVDQPIDSVTALEGLSIRSGGGSLDLVVEALGGTPVAVTSAEQYQSLERGILDGAIFNLPSMISNATMEVTGHATTNADVTSFNLSIAISEEVWEDLPSWAHEILLEAGERATEDFIQHLSDEADSTIETLRTEGNIAFHEFDDGQLAELDQLLEPVVEQWIEDMEGQGLPGRQAVEELREELASLGG